MALKPRAILETAAKQIFSLEGTTLDILDVTRPPDAEYALHLAKVVSKLSPILGNMIEYSVVKYLNESKVWGTNGEWVRRDPGFPDAAFICKETMVAGIEVKTWFPLATEITARFRESITHFTENNIDVALVAWIPEHILYGKPKIIGVWVDTAQSMAIARDGHYNNPPDYLVIEPRDTSARTSNLQQTNALGYKFQGTKSQFLAAEAMAKRLGLKGIAYDFSTQYQEKLQKLMDRFPYRLDTNFAKIDRIQHASLEDFKRKILNTVVNGHPIKVWSSIVSEDGDDLAVLIKQEKLIEDLV